MWWPGKKNNLKRSHYLLYKQVFLLVMFSQYKKLYQTHHLYSKIWLYVSEGSDFRWVTAHIVPATPKAKGRPTKSRLQLSFLLFSARCITLYFLLSRTVTFLTNPHFPAFLSLCLSAKNWISSRRKVAVFLRFHLKISWKLVSEWLGRVSFSLCRPTDVCCERIALGQRGFQTSLNRQMKKSKLFPYNVVGWKIYVVFLVVVVFFGCLPEFSHSIMRPPRTHTHRK